MRRYAVLQKIYASSLRGRASGRVHRIKLKKEQQGSGVRGCGGRLACDHALPAASIAHVSFGTAVRV
jgi:hypothetical protein